jgi:kynureninase
MSIGFEPTLEFAKQKDREDEINSFRNEFCLPEHNDKPAVYFCGNSLGLQPKNVSRAIQQELEDWQNIAIDGYLHAKNPWLYYQHNFCKPLSKIVGCHEEEVTVMNTLTVNLHFMLLSFYRPGKQRYKIMMEAGAFPSDQYAIETQLNFYGLNPADAIIEVCPRTGQSVICEEDILESIHAHRDSLAMVLFGGINYYSGQVFDIRKITAAAHQAGAIAGFDLAHAAGNIEMQLHDWDVDFAVWCSYKYLNGGPGAVGGVYIHKRFATNTKMNRMGGWWGNDEKTRFEMKKGFIPKSDASSWNISTAQVFNMVSLKASLELFDMTSMKNCRKKSIALTGYLEFLLNKLTAPEFEIITPAAPERRGAQLSLFFKKIGKQIHKKMMDSGIVVDYREPGVIRVAPAPLYNTFEEVYIFYEILNDF